VDRYDLCFGRNRVVDVNRRGELPVLTEKHRARSRHVHGDERMQEARGQATLHDETTELRAGGKRRVEVQRVVVARNLRELTDVLGCERQAT
jgi:hypothetical protein